MNRSAKRHRSTKVPNVKLRPAPAEASGSRKDRRQQEAEAEREDLAHYRRLREAYKTGKARASEDDDDDDDDDGTAQGCDEEEDTPPLLGCVICMTGIVEDKSKLVEYATTLGAQIQGNLTEDATHLIAQTPGSDKYHCAVRLGLPILRPEWIRELRARWTTAVDYDFDGLMEEYRLDTFESLVAALAGITEPAERTEIRMKLKSGSAKTPTTFTLDGSFTHLICGDIKDSKTMHVVARYRQKADRFRRRGEDLPVEGESQAVEMKAAIELRAVWKEWVEDCLEVQGSIDEKLYSVDSPRMTVAQRTKIKDAILHEKAARGRANRERMQAARHLSRARSTGRHVGAAREGKSGTTGSHDIRRIVKKPRIEMDQYVQQITSGGKDTMVPSTASDDILPEKSATKGLQRIRSFIDPSEQPAVPERRTPSSDLLPPRSAADAPPEQNKGSVPMDEDDDDEEEDDDMTLEEEPAAGLYADIREKSLASLSFRVDLRDEDRNRAARKALAGQKIKNIVSAGDAEDAHFHILPLGKVAVERAGSAVLGVPVTHLFVERCLFESRIVALSESFALQPAAVELPVQGAEKVFVALTGFAAEDDMDRKQVEIALRAAGLDVSSTLKRGHHTHLLLGKEASTSKSSQMKMQRAKEWGIHIVDFDFVDRIYRSGEVDPAVSPAGPSHRLQDTMRQRRGESVGASIGETQRMEPRAEPGPLTVNKQVSNALETSRPWQRSASSSQAFLDGEWDRGTSFGNHLPGSSLRHAHVESLEAGSQAIKTSAEQVMALLGSRKPTGNNGGDGSPVERSDSATSTNAARKRGRFLHSRLREKRADSEKVAGSDAASAEELLALRREEEYLQQQGGGGGLLGPTQMVSSSLSHHLLPSSQRVVQDESLRITYDDPVSRRERRKIGDLIATSVKNLQAQKERDEELRERGGSTRSSSTEGDEEGVEEQQKPAVGRMSRTKSMSTSPTKMTDGTAAAATAFQPSIQARKQPGTSNRL